MRLVRFVEIGDKLTPKIEEDSRFSCRGQNSCSVRSTLR